MRRKGSVGAGGRLGRPRIENFFATARRLRDLVLFVDAQLHHNPLHHDLAEWTARIILEPMGEDPRAAARLVSAAGILLSGGSESRSPRLVRRSLLESVGRALGSTPPGCSAADCQRLREWVWAAPLIPGKMLNGAQLRAECRPLYILAAALVLEYGAAGLLNPAKSSKLCASEEVAMTPSEVYAGLEELEWLVQRGAPQTVMDFGRALVALRQVAGTETQPAALKKVLAGIDPDASIPRRFEDAPKALGYLIEQIGEGRGGFELHQTTLILLARRLGLWPADASGEPSEATAGHGRHAG